MYLFISRIYKSKLRMYLTFVKRFEKVGCKVFTTQSEYESSNSKRRYKFKIVAACGHESFYNRIQRKNRKI